MLKIRLQRFGAKNDPKFRVVLTDSRNSTKSGKFLEILGFYNPVQKEKKFETDRIKYWISNGAQLTNTVHNLLVKAKIIEGKTINVLPSKTAMKKNQPEAETPKEEKPAEGEVSTEEPKKEEVRSTEETPTSEASSAEAVEAKEEKPEEPKKKKPE